MTAPRLFAFNVREVTDRVVWVRGPDLATAWDRVRTGDWEDAGNASDDGATTVRRLASQDVQ